MLSRPTTCLAVALFCGTGLIAACATQPPVDTRSACEKDGSCVLVTKKQLQDLTASAYLKGLSEGRAMCTKVGL